jgi:hypothetical protein
MVAQDDIMAATKLVFDPFSEEFFDFTVLAEDPYTVAPEQLNRIPLLGTAFAGRWFPASR